MRRTLVIHPFLFAAWSVLFIYAQNVQFASFGQVWLPLGILLALALAMFGAFLVILRHPRKAGALVSLFFILFFSFAHVYTFVWGEGSGYFATPESLMLMVVWALIFVAGSGLIVRLKRAWAEVTQILNIVALTLIALSLFQIATYEVRAREVEGMGLESAKIPDPIEPTGEPLPDIYYIILDAYAREDILKELYAYDNSDFVIFLSSRGFFVASASQSNYAQTDLSLASSLNVTYLDDLARAVPDGTLDRRPFENMIQHSAVVDFLTRSGYEIVALPSGYSVTEMRSADQFEANERVWNEIETRLVCSTPLPWLTVRGTLLDPYQVHRERILYNLKQLPGTAKLPSPRFVFAHILAPHAPFVFDAAGHAIDPAEQFDLRTVGPSNNTGEMQLDYVSGYTGQVTFVNTQMMDIVDQLIASTRRPTIIVLQSDHGPDGLVDWEDPDNTYFKEKHAILNAYLLPGDGGQLLYDEITPVNTFRLILSHYLGADLELLEDRSYFSTWNAPYDLIDVTADVRTGRRPRAGDQ